MWASTASSMSWPARRSAVTARPLYSLVQVTTAFAAMVRHRALTVVYTAYLALSLTDPALAIAPLLKDTTPLIGVIAPQLRAAQEAGDTPERLDPAAEALALNAMSAGLGTSVITGQSTPAQAQDVIDYHLNRLFPG
jgi:hypothetical protein